MRYISTRDNDKNTISASEAIIKGICPLGGLYVPESFPSPKLESLLPLSNSYYQLAASIMQPYLGYPLTEVLDMAKKAYGANFDADEIAPLHALGEYESVLELWHGPTLAFKDMALQFLPHVMLRALKETGEDKSIYILVATSGDTGKAALAGFCDVPGTKVQVFYPNGGVSKMQWLQMVTQPGDNVYVCGIEGNFDDAQTAVKNIFSDKKLNRKAQSKGYRLSSANSINFGRLLPQIVYYYSSYLKLVNSGKIQIGDEINFCVPTGNFGNILAGYYAYRMGLPVKKLICASNRNNVLFDFFLSGKYNSNRPFYQSMSCSIDILVSSNLERLLFEAANRDTKTLMGWMDELKTKGSFKIEKSALHEISPLFYADWCDELETINTMRDCFEETGYLMDPHTAVAQTAYENFAIKEKTKTHTVLVSTAHPFKFAGAVLSAFQAHGEDDFSIVQQLSERTGLKIPEAITALKGLPIRHNSVCEIEDMPKRTLEVLK